MKVKVKSNVTENILEVICRNRGVDYNNLDRFLCPSKEDISNPLIYTNLQKLVENLFEAISGNKKMFFVVDSDVYKTKKIPKKFDGNIYAIYDEET